MKTGTVAGEAYDRTDYVHRRRKRRELRRERPAGGRWVSVQQWFVDVAEGIDDGDPTLSCEECGQTALPPDIRPECRTRRSR